MTPKVDTRLLNKVLKYLDSPEGEKVTKIDHLAAIFNLPVDLFMGKCNDRRVLDKLKIHSAIIKAKMRDTWQFGRNATLNLSAYKLLADSEEIERLNGESANKTLDKKDPLLEVLQPERIWNE